MKLKPHAARVPPTDSVVRHPLGSHAERWKPPRHIFCWDKCWEGTLQAIEKIERRQTGNDNERVGEDKYVRITSWLLSWEFAGK